ncbi:MAG: lipopolysaccharide biosynthesis protein, partial [Vallitaleaceae bacterium]|nr:lipopolysaccharide biosynthesis protein [Vallitaleaceae bacterium]
MLKDRLLTKFNNSLVGYLPIKIAEGLIGILALKVYTSLFAPQIYGQYTLTNTTISIFSIVCLGWIVQAISRFSNAYSEDKAQKDAFFSTIIFTWFLIIVLLSALFLGLNWIFPTLLNNLSISFGLMLVLLWIGYSVSQVMLSYLLYSDNRLLNAVLLLLSASVKLGLTYVLTLFIGNIILSIFIAQAATDLAVGIIAIFKSHLKPHIKIKAYSKNMLKQLIAYGYPLIGMGLIMTLLNMSDRYIIKFFYDSTEVGLYTSNYSLASAAFTMLMVGLSRGSYPKILEAWHKKDYSTAERTLSAGGKYFMMFGLP